MSEPRHLACSVDHVPLLYAGALAIDDYKRPGFVGVAPLSERAVEPVGHVAKAGIWYLVAREPAKGYRTFSAQRIAGVDELAEPFVRPADFNLESYEQQSIDDSYEVVLRVAKASVGGLAPYWETASSKRTFSKRARVARPVFIDGKPGAVWMHAGEVGVAFRFTIMDDRITAIDLIADRAAIAQLVIER